MKILSLFVVLSLSSCIVGYKSSNKIKQKEQEFVALAGINAEGFKSNLFAADKLNSSDTIGKVTDFAKFRIGAGVVSKGVDGIRSIGNNAINTLGQ